MGKLELAAERLTTALNALEARLVPLEGVRAEAGEAKARLAALDAERDRLLARIAELEDEQRLLGEISQEVEARLDGAIGDIRVALGR
jgi:chromosome segregation ATPase